jgi:hypothetical protein
VGDDALHALATLIPYRAGDRVAINDFRSHGRHNAIEVFIAIMVIS